MASKAKLARNRASRDRLRHIVEAWKSGGCVVCGEVDPVVLVAHHREPGKKTQGISKLVARKAPLCVLLLELSKCVVLCHNDHARLHAGKLKLP